MASGFARWGLLIAYLHYSRAMRVFVGIALDEEPAPNETTICKFRHLMERHNPWRQRRRF